MGINYLVLSSKVSFGKEISEWMKGTRHVPKTVTTEGDLKKELETTNPTVVIIGAFQQKSPYDVAREFSLKYRNIVVILMLPAEEVDLKKGLYSGAVDILTLPCSRHDFLDSIEKADGTLSLKLDQDPMGELERDKNGKVIVFLSTKGGVGKTTLAVNAATALAKKNLQVAVLDLDLQFGDVPLLFDKEPKATIYEWVKESLDSADGQVDAYMIRHHSGVEFMAAPLLPEFAELITGDHVSRLIEVLKKRYDVIIIDTPPSLVETNLVALDFADDILLITSFDLPALKNGKLAVDTMGLLGLADKIKIVLNRDAEMKGMDFHSIEGVLGTSVFARIPSDYMTVISSINKGVPFVISASRTQVAKATMHFAESLVTEVVTSNSGKKTKTRFTRILFGKKNQAK